MLFHLNTVVKKEFTLDFILRVFVCLFAVNAKTTARIDAKQSEIIKNNPESVLHGLELPVLGDIVTFLFFPLRLTAIFTYLSSTSGSCLNA